MSNVLKYMFLFPLLGCFSFFLLALGGTGFSVEFELFDRRIHEMEPLTISSGKSLANIVEIWMALLIGAVDAVMLYVKNKKGKVSWNYVGKYYLLVLIMYFLVPALPE